ncbi:MAG: hypothetical protein JRC92_00870 [Deltaproteobacteria bacterium]|nr:hypothetical protein [Deltaproteobacteria bacterium]
MLETKTDTYQGQIKKTARVESNDPDRPALTITLKALVMPIFKVEPFKQIVLSTPVGKPVSQKVTLTFSLEEPVEITGLSHQVGDLIQTELTTIEAGRVYEITVSTDARQEKRAKGSIRLEFRNAPIKAAHLQLVVNVWRPKKAD